LFVNFRFYLLMSVARDKFNFIGNLLITEPEFLF